LSDEKNTVLSLGPPHRVMGRLFFRAASGATTVVIVMATAQAVIGGGGLVSPA
jgi:hypothetical protein